MMKLTRSFGYAALALVLMTAGEAAAQGPGNHQDFWHMGDWGWQHMMFGGGVMMILFWVIVIAVIAAVVWLFRRGGGKPS